MSFQVTPSEEFFLKYGAEPQMRRPEVGPPVQGASGSHNPHSRLAPSSSARWSTCTASVPYAIANAHRIPEDKGSVWADEGTQAHDYAADVLTGKITIEGVPGNFLLGENTNKNFRPHVKLYVDHCLSLTGNSGEVIIERSVPLFYRPEDTGTVDFAVVSDKAIHIRDLKYGAGVEVEAEGNTQLAIYALSLVRDLVGLYAHTPDTPVTLGIVQPRYRGSEPIKIWELTIGGLEAFCAPIAAAAQAIDSGFTRFAPSEKACRWCKCKGFCDARYAHALEGFGDDIESGIAALEALPDLTKEEMKLPLSNRLDVVEQIGGVTPDQLVAIWRKRKAITRLLDDAEEYLTGLANAGTPAPGTKLVQGRPGNRKWKDEEAADKMLRGIRLLEKDRYRKVLVSPTVAAELLELELRASPRFRAKFESHVTRGDGRPVLADEDDKRPAIAGDLELLPEMEPGEEGL